MDALLASNIQVILGERLDMQSILFADAIKLNKQGQRVARTLQGREVAADLIVGSLSPTFCPVILNHL